MLYFWVILLHQSQTFLIPYQSPQFSPQISKLIISLPQGQVNLNSNSSESPDLWEFDLNVVYSPPENLPQYFYVAKALYFPFWA